MRPPTEMREPRPRRRLSGRRILLIILVIALIVLITSLRGLAIFYTDFLWFDSLGYASVWRKVLWARIGLGLLFIGVFFIVMWINLFIADRLAPKVRPAGPEEELIERYHEFVGRRVGWVRFAVSLAFALIAGASVSGQWENWLLFTNRVNFGIADPQFGRDIGFYVFQLPFLSFLVSWGFAAILIIFIVTAVAHYLNGGIRVQVAPGIQRVTPQVKAHLSLLLGLLALIKAGGYWLDRFELTLSTRGTVDGATYTDVNAQLPAINLLLLISLFSCGLLIFNIWQRGFVLPILAVGLWALVAVVAGSIYPAFIQRFRVEPSESNREATFIQRNITATRAGYRLDEINERDFNFEPVLSAEAINDNRVTVDNVRLLDPGIIQDTFQRLQGIRGFYEFNDVDIDRYIVDGQLTQVVLSARELNTGGLPNNSWEAQNIAFTHGYAAAVAPANQTDTNGRPNFIVRDVPTTFAGDSPALRIETTGIYFGEGLGGFGIVGANRDEIDFLDTSTDAEATTRYDGDGGVSIGSFLRRAAFALRFGDINPLISSEITGDSRILYIRDIRARAETLAPFLSYDHDPYPVLLDGRMLWVMDAYTTTDRYPYAQRVENQTRSELRGRGLDHGFNYVRNSVKVVIDAFHGSVDFYVVDDTDPLVKAYRKIFPRLFSDLSEAPEGLEEHFRYPEDLFLVQTSMWGRYRLGQSLGFYNSSGRWDVAQDPGDVIGQVAQESVQDEQGNVIALRDKRIPPQYLLMRLPDDTEESFLMFRPFVPFSDDDTRQDLAGFMVAHSDPGRYGEIEVFEVISGGLRVDGPAQFNSRINTEADISREISLLNQQGSRVRPGNLLLFPIGDSLLYVRPLFIEATQSDTPIPVLERVIVGFGNSVAMRDNFEEALQAVLEAEGASAPDPVASDDGEPATTPTTEPPTTEPPTTEVPPTTLPPPEGSVSDLLQRALDAFAEADAALRDGDLAGYEDALQRAETLIRQAEQLSEDTTTGTTAPSSDA